MGDQTTIERPLAMLDAIVPNYQPRSREILPPPRSNHWVLRQKLAVVEAVNTGQLELREAMRRYELSLEEFMTWEDAWLRDSASSADRRRARERMELS